MNKFSYLIIGVILGTSLWMIFSFSDSNKESESENEDSKVETQTDTQVLTNMSPVFNPPVPSNLDFAGEEVPLSKNIVNEKIQKEFLSNSYWHSNTYMYFKRAGRWFPLIEKILKEKGIPEDFKYLAVIESGLTNATSPSGAKGFWQFMPKTAKDYGLEVTDQVEERYDVEKSTYAACVYLQKAYDKFGSWTLAAASYNMGKTGLHKQLSKQRCDNYYDLLLNVETGRYVYRILAVKSIMESPKIYGFMVNDDDVFVPFKTKSIEISKSISNIADFAIDNNTTYAIVKRLNPWIKNNALQVSEGKTYFVRLPDGDQGLTPFKPSSNKFLINE